jgi:hypothetical protein
MARKKRRKRARAHQSEVAVIPIESVAVEMEADAGPRPSVDKSCLVHPGYDLLLSCKGCGVAVCEACTVVYAAEQLCTDCVSARVLRHPRPGGGWRGYVSMALGLVAMGALLAPFTFAADPQFSQGLPGGRAFFVYVALISACAGIVTGASSQDFDGAARRAGKVGLCLAAFVLVVDVVMKAMTLFL